MAGLIAALAALVEFCAAVVGMVLEALGIGIGHLAEKSEEGESRFSGKRLLVAFSPLILVTSFIAGILWYFDWRAEVRRERERETRQLVEGQAGRLIGQVDEHGHLIRHEKDVLDVEDAWGNPLHVRYDETLLHESVSVHSDGADKKADTPDDLSSSRRRLRPKKDIAKDAVVGMKDKIFKRILKRD